jgi:hypothetical protein
MNHVDQQLREEARKQAREQRIDLYARWLADDADGLAFNLTHPAGQPIATAILAEAREKVALALGRIDQAIAKDKEAHKE